MHPMSGLLDDAENFVARCKFRALVPQLEIRAAQRRARNTYEHFACAHVRNFHALNCDAFVPVKYGGLHCGVGPIDCCHFDACN